MSSELVSFGRMLSTRTRPFLPSLSTGDCTWTYSRMASLYEKTGCVSPPEISIVGFAAAVATPGVATPASAVPPTRRKTRGIRTLLFLVLKMPRPR
ncbi:hypothetical protein ABZU75_28570 [Streptosporangium sp. NPDC005286]|uniref:hypothetical protein n=1 Tax=Streptosporangium sp. NPDC005286 TaxID=3154463 RepID=UPI0033B0C653